VLNVSPDSFYPGSVAADFDDLARRAETAAREGADLLDVGAMSTRPLQDTSVSAAEEADRLAAAVARVRSVADLPVSADTQRAGPAAAALDAGATIVNDVSGLADDPSLASLVAARGADIVVMARGLPPGEGRPIVRATTRLRACVGRALAAGIPAHKITVDPGIGFTVNAEMSAADWNLRLLRDLAYMRRLGRPVLIAVSRKGFVGRILGLPDPADRLTGSLAATAVAVANGAHVVRTHDVAATRQAVRVAEAIRDGRLPE
jgi:dihydropteroate synthase